MENHHHPERKNFQIDRMILFTDAVFAIAITLLVIDLKVPSIPENGTEQDFLNSISQQLPNFIGFIMSFFIIGLYWFLHHKIFGFVTNYTNKLIWLNLIFLLSIVLMPYTTSIYSEYSTDERIMLISPYAMYVFNLCFTGFTEWLLLKYIYNPKNKVAELLPSLEVRKSALRRALMVPLVFFFSLLLTFASPEFGRLFLFTIPIFNRILAPKKIKKVDN